MTKVSSRRRSSTSPKILEPPIVLMHMRGPGSFTVQTTSCDVWIRDVQCKEKRKLTETSSSASRSSLLERALVESSHVKCQNTDQSHLTTAVSQMQGTATSFELSKTLSVLVPWNLVAQNKARSWRRSLFRPQQHSTDGIYAKIYHVANKKIFNPSVAPCTKNPFANR